MTLKTLTATRKYRTAVRKTAPSTVDPWMKIRGLWRSRKTDAVSYQKQLRREARKRTV